PPELVGRAEKREPALQHEPDAGSEQQPLTHVVRHEDHALAEPPLERRELTLQLHPGNGIERAERLVQEQERRVDGEGARAPPATCTSPDVGSSKRLMSLSVVVFPDPLRPRSTRVSPAPTVKETSRTRERPFPVSPFPFPGSR